MSRTTSRAANRTMSNFARWTRGCAAWIGVAALVDCKGAAPKRQTPPTPVRVSPVARIDAPVVIVASGVVEPVQTVSVTTQVTGSLLDVLFKEGDFVQAGQVLFRIDPRSFAAAADQARAVLARDEAQAEAARKDDERYRRLADMGYVSRSQSDQMHATAVAQAATVVADQAALRSAQVTLGFTTIRAPIAGRTGSLLVRRGNNVSPGGSPLVVINQISPVLVRFPVLDNDFDALRRAVAMHALAVKAVSSDSSEASDQGQLSFLDNAVDSLTGTVTGKASFPNTGRRLWPGELVFLSVQLDVQRGVLAVPSEAVQIGQQGPYVYVVDQKQTAQTRPVTPGIQVGDLTVIQKGVAAGERVVIDGQSRLNPGARVAILGAGTDTGTARMRTGSGQGSAAGDIVTGRAGTNAPSVARGGGGAPSATPTVTPTITPTVTRNITPTLPVTTAPTMPAIPAIPATTTTTPTGTAGRATQPTTGVRPPVTPTPPRP
ncbi:MAG: family efflux pump rane fusion lipoprotein [Gemmatimonadetes bacterium]|nr:family efflux pump rane fusion lipoprotein [Gemmatimonadota bacterium]